MAEKYEIVVTQKAEKSLEQIVLYLEKETSYQTADRVRISLLEVIFSLDKNPESNGIIHEISDEEVEYRRVLKWSYRVIYHIDKIQALIYVIEIDHVKRDPRKLLKAFGQ